MKTKLALYLEKVPKRLARGSALCTSIIALALLLSAPVAHAGEVSITFTQDGDRYGRRFGRFQRHDHKPYILDDILNRHAGVPHLLLFRSTLLTSVSTFNSTPQCRWARAKA